MSSPDHFPQPAAGAVMAPVVPQQYAYPGPSLRQLIVIVWAYRHRTLVAALLFAILGVVGSQFLTKTYSATATLLIAYEINDPLSDQSFPINLVEGYINTQIELMRSRSVMFPVIDTLGLLDSEAYAGFTGSVDERRERVYEDLLRKVKFSTGSWGSFFIYISYEAPTAAAAAELPNAVANEYLARKNSWVINPASDRADRYTEKLNQFKSNVDVAQARVTAFRQESGLMDMDNAAQREIERLSSLEGALQQAEDVWRTAKARQEQGVEVDAEVMQSMAIRDLKQKMSTLRTEMVELRNSLGARHPRIVELQSQIDDTEAQYQRELAGYSGSAAATVRRAQQRYDQLKLDVDNQRAKVAEVRRLQDQGKQFLLDLESASLIYEQALRGYDQVLLTSGSQYSNVKLVSPAVPPIKASGLSKAVFVVGFTLVGGGLGLCGSMFWEFLFRRVRCSDDIERDFGVPVLVELGRKPVIAEVGA